MTMLLTGETREDESLVGYLEAGDAYRTCVARLHEPENEGGASWMRAKRGVFAGESDPFAVRKWNGMHAALEAAIDSCESSGRLIERLIAGHRA